MTVSQEEQARDDLKRMFPTMVCGDVQQMKTVIDEARGLYKNKRTQYIHSRLLLMVQRLKKQGTLFGYPLVSDVSNYLEKLIQNSTEFSDSDLVMMRNTVLLLQEILWKKISGDGGEKGRKILNQLTRIKK